MRLIPFTPAQMSEHSKVAAGADNSYATTLSSSGVRLPEGYAFEQDGTTAGAPTSAAAAAGDRRSSIDAPEGQPRPRRSRSTGFRNQLQPDEAQTWLILE
eukprot:gene6086-6326_t